MANSRKLENRKEPICVFYIYYDHNCGCNDVGMDVRRV